MAIAKTKENVISHFRESRQFSGGGILGSAPMLANKRNHAKRERNIPN